MKKLLMLGILTMAVASCVTHESRPEGWADTLNNCAAINGSYRTQGVSGTGSYTPDLGQILLGLSSEPDSIIKLTTAENMLQIELLQGNESIQSSTLGFSCRGGMVVFTPITNEGFINREGVAGYMGESIKLVKLADGSLAIRDDGIGAGIMLLIPFVVSTQSWYMFESET